MQSNHYVAWTAPGASYYEYAKNSIICGWTSQAQNIFDKSMQYKGKLKTLPKIKVNDRVGLIYDSNESMLSFELNNVLLDGCLVNLPKNEDLFWMIGAHGDETNVIIIE